MKLTLTKAEFLKALDLTSGIAQKSSSLPIIQNILLETTDNILKIAATNLEVGTIFWALAKVEQEGKIAVPASVLAGLASSLSGEKIELNSQNNNLIIKSQNGLAKILGQESENYPIIPVLKEVWCKIEAEGLSLVLSQVVDFTAQSQMRPELSGVYLKFASSEIVAAASDSFRLAEKRIKSTPQELKKEASVILPRGAAREIVNALQDSPGLATVYLSENQLMIETWSQELNSPKLQITSQLIEGSFPNYQQIIPKEFKTQALFHKEALINNLKLVGIFSGRNPEVRIDLDPKSQLTRLFAQSSEVGENEANLSSKIKGEKITIYFNHRFLTEGLAKFKSQQVAIHFSSPEGPAIVKAPEDDSYFYIIMPIKQR